MFLMGLATFSANVLASLDVSRFSTNIVRLVVAKRSFALSLIIAVGSSCADASLTAAKYNKRNKTGVYRELVRIGLL